MIKVTIGEDLKKFNKELIEGKYDEVLNNSMLFSQALNDKQRMLNHMANGLTIDEAYIKMFEENIESLNGIEESEIIRSIKGVEKELESKEMSEYLEMLENIISKEEIDLFRKCAKLMSDFKLEIA